MTANCPHCGQPMPTATAAALTEAEFDMFYAQYPRKEGRAAALRAYKTARKKAGEEELVAGLGRSVAFWQADGRLQAKPYTKVPHAATWLNGERWKDDYGQQEQPDAGDAAKRLAARLNGGHHAAR
jgi:hypothetical protein